MGDKQLQTINHQSYALARSRRPRGLVAQISMALLEPGEFFRALPFAESSRQWMWAGLLVLALVGFSAVRQDALVNGAAAPAPDLGAVPTGDLGGGGGAIAGGPGMIMRSDPFGGGETPPVPTEPAAASTDVSATWTTALLAASGVILGWFILTLLLCEVSLFNGAMPRLGRNLQIAVWASVPIGLMAALQLLFYAAGGTVGEPGISGLLSNWDGYAGLPVFVKSILLSLTSRLTLFWLWSLVLIYTGGRMALRGKVWAVLLVVAAWMVVVVVMPVLTGAITAPQDEAAAVELLAPEMPSGEGNLPEFSGGADAGSGQPADTLPPDALSPLPEITAEATGDASTIPDMPPGADSTPEVTPPSAP